MENKNTFVVHLHCFLLSVYWYTASYPNYEERNVITRRDPGEERGLTPRLTNQTNT